MNGLLNGRDSKGFFLQQCCSLMQLVSCEAPLPRQISREVPPKTGADVSPTSFGSIRSLLNLMTSGLTFLHMLYLAFFYRTCLSLVQSPFSIEHTEHACSNHAENISKSQLVLIHFEFSWSRRVSCNVVPLFGNVPCYHSMSMHIKACQCNTQIRSHQNLSTSHDI